MNGKRFSFSAASLTAADSPRAVTTIFSACPWYAVTHLPVQIYLLFLVYPRTCETIVIAFRCYELQDGDSFLLADFNILCDDEYQACGWCSNRCVGLTNLPTDSRSSCALFARP